MQEENSGAERPKIAPKPVIPSKPRFVPPVKLEKRIIQDENTSTGNIPRYPNISDTRLHKEYPKPRDFRQIPRNDKHFGYKEVYTSEKSNYFSETKQIASESSKYREYSSTYIDEKCDKFSTNLDTLKILEGFSPKAPQSPSTVCCSILSNATTDCCGVINVNKKELPGKAITKIDSLDSNSSDSGGFKDFVQLDIFKKPSPDKDVKYELHQTHHQRKASQSDFVLKTASSDNNPPIHQRQLSHSEFSSSEVRQSLSHKQNVANAQALAQFLPQTEQKLLQHKQSKERNHEEFLQHVARFSEIPAQPSEDPKFKPPKPVLKHSQFQQSTKKLEELLAQRLEKDKVLKKGQSCLVEGESSQDVEHKVMIQKQLQQKLQADLQQTVKQIQEIQSIELRLPQNRKWTEVCVVLVWNVPW
ncbi:unnamed protein product [Phaedon cochleariae]|uniref:Uncharacterized protein n=1 Tax=Phaedon cochleariae TaxID=80249 RepID=A0A9N9SP48_PHACE|nr:unnamed protein product [Phaedon cochleariae]